MTHSCPHNSAASPCAVKSPSNVQPAPPRWHPGPLPLVALRRRWQGLLVYINGISAEQGFFCKASEAPHASLCNRLLDLTEEPKMTTMRSVVVVLTVLLPSGSAA